MTPYRIAICHTPRARFCPSFKCMQYIFPQSILAHQIPLKRILQKPQSIAQFDYSRMTFDSAFHQLSSRQIRFLFLVHDILVFFPNRQKSMKCMYLSGNIDYRSLSMSQNSNEEIVSFLESPSRVSHLVSPPRSLVQTNTLCVIQQRQIFDSLWRNRGRSIFAGPHLIQCAIQRNLALKPLESCWANFFFAENEFRHWLLGTQLLSAMLKLSDIQNHRSVNTCGNIESFRRNSHRSCSVIAYVTAQTLLLNNN